MADTDGPATVGGAATTLVDLHVPGDGVWFYDADLADDSPLSGKVTLLVGTSRLEGTIADRYAGTFGLQRKIRVIAGADGWGKMLPPKPYVNDAGVKARNIADDAAREAGERLGTFNPVASTVGAKFLREAGPASRALEFAAGSLAWHVDYAGASNVGERTIVDAPASAYEVIMYDPRGHEITLGLESITAVGIGSRLTKGLDEPLIIKSLRVTVEAGGMRATAWVGKGRQSRAATAMRSIVERLSDARLFGKYRYRVSSMNGKRVNLQAVSKAPGLPDFVSAVEQAPGGGGMHFELTQGAIVYVEFIAGMRNDPAITGYGGKGTSAAVPVKTEIAGGGRKIARQGDLVQCGGAGAVLTLTPVTPAPSPNVLVGTPYLVSFGALAQPQAPLYGAIGTGSLKAETG